MDGGYAPARVFFTFRQPRSDVILRECTKSFAREQVKRGIHPKGSIWIPGCCEGSHAQPEVGDLFGPDPTWKPAKPLDAISPEYLPYQTR